MIDVMGRCLVPGRATGDVLFTDVPLSFWMGIDVDSGIIIDQHHPLKGACVTGRIFLIPGGRGSCSGSVGFLELIANGKGPAALVFERDEPILTLGAIVADEMFGKTIPVASVGPGAFAELAKCASLCVVDGRISDRHIRNGDGSAPTARVLKLAAGDQSVLAGDEGKARQAAMRIIARFCDVQGVETLIDVDQGHIDCCFYTGPAGLAFAERLCALGGTLKIPTTTNANSVDFRRWREQGADADFARASRRVGDAYVKLGARASFTCAPYLLASAPAFGQQIAWGESNAVAYANSVLGARTMKYPDLLDVCVALTGRAPLMGSHLMEGRRATLQVDLPALKELDDSFYPLLGYCVGQIAGHDIPVVTGLEKASPTPDDLKAFSAAFATTSSAPLFHIAGVTPEASMLEQALGGLQPERRVSLTHADLLAGWKELNSTAETAVNLVALGNPHFSLAELARATDLCRGAGPVAVRTIITCGRDIHAEAEKAGYIAELQRANVEVMNDTCWCMFTSAMFSADVRTIMTNSAKFAHYGPGVTGRGMRYDSFAQCVAAAHGGMAGNALPAWLTQR